MVQEPAFQGRVFEEKEKKVERDRFLLVLVNNYESMGSELHLVDTRDFTRARAVIFLPVPLRPGLHANWVDAQEVKPS